MYFGVEEAGGDVNLSNGVDWKCIFLIAVIQKGVSVLYGDKSGSTVQLLPAQMQH